MFEVEIEEEEGFIPAKFDKVLLMCKRHKKKLASVDLSKNSYRRLLCFECMKEENERTRNPMNNLLRNRYSIEDVISSKAVEDKRAKMIAYQEIALKICKDLEQRIDSLMGSLSSLRSEIRRKAENFVIASSNSHLNSMILLLATFQRKKAIEEGENLEKYIKHFLAIEKESETKILKDMHAETVFDLKALNHSLTSLQNNWKFSKKCSLTRNELLFSASVDRTINAIDMEDLQIVHTCKDVSKEKISSICSSRNQRYCVLATPKGIALYELEKNRITRYYRTAPSSSIKVFISNTERFIAFFDSHSVGIISPKLKKFVKLFLTTRKERINTLAVTANDQHFALGTSANKIILYSLVSKKLVYSFENFHQDEVNTVIFTRDSRYIISSSDDKTIKIIDILEKMPIANFFLEGHCYPLAISPSQKYIVAGTSNGKLEIIDFSTRMLIPGFQNLAGTSAIMAVCFSLDSSKIAALNMEGTIIIIHVDSGQEIAKFSNLHRSLTEVGMHDFSLSN